MATIRIISMHVTKGSTMAQSLTDRTEYSKNPEKTNGGELISSYACDPATVDAEFLFSKRQYSTLTGREQASNVIAYQIRQSFRPGEVTPEEANKLAYELASRFLKGKHAFIVCTHRDKSHVHSHIIFNSTTIDCKHKFRDFLGSGKAVARLSDTICLEHRLSIIEAPKLGNNNYNKWLGDKARPSHRELLRATIDSTLAKKPEDFEVFLKLMADTGYEVKQGVPITFRSIGQKQNIRLRSLGEDYSEEEIRAVISGARSHTPRKKRVAPAPPKTNLLIDVQAKLDAGKGTGYAQWAKVFNLKQMAQTVMFLQEHELTDYNELAAKTAAVTARFNKLATQIKVAEKRMAEIAVLKTHIINYSKTRDVYTGYKAAGYSKKYLAENESDIIIHKAAKKAFDELGVKKLPTVRSLQDEYAKLLAGKKAAYVEYRAARDEMKELLIHKNNIDHILGPDERKMEIEKGQDRQ